MQIPGPDISPALLDALRKPLLFNQRILWWAFNFTLGGYWAMLFFASWADFSLPIQFIPGALLEASAAVMVVVAIAFRRWALSSSAIAALRSDSPTAAELATDPRSGRTNEEYQCRIEMLQESERCVLLVFQRFQPRFLVSLAIHESIALFGLIACLVRRDPLAFAPFALVVLILNVWIWPSAARFHAKVRPVCESGVGRGAWQGTR